MKNVFQYISLFLLCLCLLFTQCSKTPDTPVTPKSSIKTLTSPTIDGVTGASSTFDAATSTYTVTVPSGTDVTALKVAFTLPIGATAKPVSGSVQNFTNPMIYTVTAEDGSTQTYTVKVVVIAPPTPTAPTFGTATTAQVATGIASTTAQVVSVVDKAGSISITQHGHVWSKTSQAPTLTNNTGKTELGMVAATVSFPYNFTSNLTGLEATTTYTLRAYITTSTGTTYGNAFTLTTLPATMPTGINCRLSKVTITVNNSTSEKTFEYDTQGRLSKIGYSGGYIQTYTYSANGELVSQTGRGTDSQGRENSLTGTFVYAAGRITEFTEKSVYQDKVEFDNRYKVTLNAIGQLGKYQQIGPSGQLGSEYVFTYDAAGNIISGVVDGKVVVEVVSYDNQRVAATSIVTSETHKLVLPDELEFSTGKNNALASRRYQENSGVLSSTTTNTYQYNRDGFPVQCVKMTKSSSGAITDTRTIAYTYSNCQ